MEIHTFILDTGPNGTDLEEIIGRLILDSHKTVLLRPDKLFPLDAVMQIQRLLPNWPHWAAGDQWIIAGGRSSRATVNKYARPILRNYSDQAYHLQIAAQTSITPFFTAATAPSPSSYGNVQESMESAGFDLPSGDCIVK